MIVYPQRNFHLVKDAITTDFILGQSHEVRTERWQGVDTKNRPDLTTHELSNIEFEVNLAGIEKVEVWRNSIEPNLPWADDHFAERVCGEPLNPGVQWANWPWAASANRFRDKDQRFNHTYMERYWPKVLPRQQEDIDKGYRINRIGIWQPYGDLHDLVELLAKEPLTRQAWIPIFFPEDTGYGDGGRKPCTLGYQFTVRENRLNVWYPLRSCDFVRHFSDDCYLTVRLLLWVLDRCREIDPDTWLDIVPGSYNMHCTSLHIFANDLKPMKEKYGE